MKLTELKRAREVKSITQDEMAQALGYKNKSSYCQIENGNTKITVDISRKIKEILGLSIKEYEQIFL